MLIRVVNTSPLYDAGEPRTVVKCVDHGVLEYVSVHAAPSAALEVANRHNESEHLGQHKVVDERERESV